MSRIRAFVLAFLVAAFVISMPARDCMAVTQIPYNTVVYGPLDIGGVFGLPVVEGVGVCAHDKYAAAMTALGYGGDVVTGLDSDKKALLSNQSTGGAFWTFSQHFVNPSSNGNLTERMVYRYAELYGSGVVWSAEYQASEKASAVDALETILDGGNLGGGGSGVDGDYITFSGNIRYYVGSGNTQYNWLCNDGTYLTNAYGNTNYSRLISPITLRIKLEGHLSEMVNLYPPDDYIYLCSLNRLASGNNIANIYVYALNKDAVVVYGSYNANAVQYDDAINSVTNVRIAKFVSMNRTHFTFDGTEMNVSQNGSIQWGSIVNDTSLSVVKSSVYPMYFGLGGVTPDIPPSNWPDEPEVPAPTAPEVPEPTEPERPSQPSQPTAPVLPDFPSNIISPGTTYETFDIQAILDAMDEHCQHLQSAVYQGFADYFDTFTPWLDERLELLQECIRGESVWQIQRIDADFESLKDYLHDLFEWLADQMQFTFSGDSYDDSSVISWLRRIYFKLQSSPVNTRPADPVANPDGAWDWLWQLLQDILNGLTGGAAELVGKLMSLFDGIKDKFPFSIPWDLAAVLALLDVPAQTPAFVVSYDVFGTTVTYDIDLHFMDEYAGVIRSMESVLFCFMLIKSTKWLTGIFDEVGQFLGAKLGYRG